MKYRVDDSLVSANQDSRIRSLVLHYTALDLEASKRALTVKESGVSAHYLVPDVAGDDGLFHVYRLVADERRAWHAGVSAWQGDRLLNPSSIGIEIVNLGFPSEDNALPPMQRRWYPFPEAQIAVVGELVRDLATRHDIAARKIVGHGDVAPGRKTDPGPLFPWERLYRTYGVGSWFEDSAVAWYVAHAPYDGDVGKLQGKLLRYGYDTPATGSLDAATRDVLIAFQMHFRPACYDGVPDVETVARLDALLEKYFDVPRP